MQAKITQIAKVLKKILLSPASYYYTYCGVVSLAGILVIAFNPINYNFSRDVFLCHAFVLTWIAAITWLEEIEKITSWVSLFKIFRFIKLVLIVLGSFLNRDSKQE